MSTPLPLQQQESCVSPPHDGQHDPESAEDDESISTVPHVSSVLWTCFKQADAVTWRQSCVRPEFLHKWNVAVATTILQQTMPDLHEARIATWRKRAPVPEYGFLMLVPQNSSAADRNIARVVLARHLLTLQSKVRVPVVNADSSIESNNKEVDDDDDGGEPERCPVRVLLLHCATAEETTSILQEFDKNAAEYDAEMTGYDKTDASEVHFLFSGSDQVLVQAFQTELDARIQNYQRKRVKDSGFYYPPSEEEVDDHDDLESEHEEDGANKDEEEEEEAEKESNAIHGKESGAAAVHATDTDQEMAQ